jgi:hypothetical protein
MKFGRKMSVNNNNVQEYILLGKRIVFVNSVEVEGAYWDVIENIKAN